MGAGLNYFLTGTYALSSKAESQTWGSTSKPIFSWN